MKKIMPPPSSVPVSVFDSLGRHFMLRPIVLFSHILLIVLVTSGSREDRLWNMKVDRLIPFESIVQKFNCSYFGYSECCEASNLMTLDSLYFQAQHRLRNLDYIELLISVSTLTVVFILFSYLLELTFLGKVDHNNWCHQLVNKISGISYIFCLFLLSHGILEMVPQDPNLAELCGEKNHVNEATSSPKLEMLSSCYIKLGACRNRDSLTVILLFVIGYPIICVCCYLLAGTFSCMMDESQMKHVHFHLLPRFNRSAASSSSAAAANTSGLRSMMVKMKTGGVQYKINKGGESTGKRHQLIVPTHFFTNLEHNQGRDMTTLLDYENNPKEMSINDLQNPNLDLELGSLLNELESKPEVRHNENYLKKLATSFKNYVRNGNTPKILYAITKQPKSILKNKNTKNDDDIYKAPLENKEKFETNEKNKEEKTSSSSSMNTETLNNRHNFDMIGQCELPPSYNEILLRHAQPYHF